MGLTTLIDSRPLGLEIMPDPIKHGQGNVSDPKYLSLTIYLTQGNMG